jgi:type III secretory pathway lipoprotein EscJ
VTDSKTADNNASSTGTTPAVSSDVQFDITKIIYSGNISLYTDDYKSTLAKIGEYAVKIGGFVQDSNSSYIDKTQNTVVNSGYITIRVPAAKYEEAMNEIQKYGSPISSSTNSTNIFQQYQDVKGQLDNLKIEEQRLLGYLTKAGNIQDLLSIESELNRVRTEIDNRTTIIKNWDKEIAYSTISVSVYEKKLSTSTVKSPFSDILQKIKEGFITSINLLLIMLAELIVWIFRLIPFAAVLGAAYFIYSRFRKKKNDSK